MQNKKIKLGIIGDQQYIDNCEKIFSSIIHAEVAYTKTLNLNAINDHELDSYLNNFVEEIQNTIPHTKIDAICISVPNCIKSTIATSYIEAGKHVLIQGPIASNYKEAKRIAFATGITTSSLIIMDNSTYYSALDIAVLDILKNKTIGEIREISAIYKNNTYSSSIDNINNKQLIKYNGIHIDMLTCIQEMIYKWLKHKPEWLIADGTFFTTNRKNSLNQSIEVEIPESITVMGRFMFGSRFLYHVSEVHHGEENLEICINGEYASLNIYPLINEIYLIKDNKKQKVLLKNTHLTKEEYFINQITSGAPQTLDDALTNMKIIDNIWESWTHQAKMIHL